MHRCLRMVVVALVASGACSSSTEETRVTPETQSGALRSSGRIVTILHVTDTHSHLEAIGPRDRHLDGTRGGLVKAATVIAREKARNQDALLVHAGDLFQEDVYFGITGGAVELQLLSTLGLDAMTVGNHEFNLTPDALLGALAAAFEPVGASGATLAPSPVVTANLQHLETHSLQAFIQPRLVKEIDGLRVGFFGLVVDDPAEQFSCTEPCTPLAIDVVVLLSHLGFDRDEVIAREVPGIDAIIGGHDHLRGTRLVSGPTGKDVPIVHAGEFYEWVGKLTLSVEQGVVSFVREEFLPVDVQVRRYEPFAEIVSGAEGLQALATSTYGEDLFHTAIAFTPSFIAQDPLPDAPERDSPIANLITDALRHAGGTDVAWTANGLLTEGLAPGFLVAADAFRIVGDGFDPAAPFGARLGAPLIRLAMPDFVLWGAIQGALAAGGDYFPQVSGMTVTWDPSLATAEVKVGGAELAFDGTPYTVTMDLPAFLGLESLLVGAPYELLPSPDVTEYEAVRDWMALRKLLVYGPEGRIVDVSRL